MRRKLYLIISDGGGNTPLRGVHIDKDNFLNFFKAPEGGAWKDDEILVFENNFSAAYFVSRVAHKGISKG